MTRRISVIWVRRKENVHEHLEIRPEGQDKSVLTVPEANFEKGKYYTIVVTGHSKGMPKLQAMMIEDQLAAATPTAANQKAESQEPKMVKTKAAK